MAGIGFELKKLFKRRGLFAAFRAYGYAGVVCTGPMLLGIVLLLGVVMVFLGVLGEYIGRIYDESKARPLYLVSDTVNIEAAYER